MTTADKTQKHKPEPLDKETIEKKYWKDIYAYAVKYAKDGVPPNGCND